MLQFNVHVMVVTDTVHHAPMAISASEKSTSSRLCFCGSRKAPQ